MLTFGALGFAAPAILYALIALPILWWLLRAVPPAPVRRRFPGIALLLGLRDRDPESQRTPWWLLMLRVGALAALIVALAGPVLNPVQVVPGRGPLLIVLDGSWASGRDWPRRIERVSQALGNAQRAGRPAAVVVLTDPPVGAVEFRAADRAQERLPGLTPQPWDPSADQGWASDLPEGTQTLWISDGLARDMRADLLTTLARGDHPDRAAQRRSRTGADPDRHRPRSGGAGTESGARAAGFCRRGGQRHGPFHPAAGTAQPREPVPDRGRARGRGRQPER